MNKVHFSSVDLTYETPPRVFDYLDARFRFDLDVCCVAVTAKCCNYLTPEDDGLTSPWWGSCWMNPPYGRQIHKWMKRATQQVGTEPVDIIVALVPARTDTRWWHEWVMPFADEIKFVQGRLRFLKNGVEEENSAPFPSAVIIYRKDVPVVEGPRISSLRF